MKHFRFKILWSLSVLFVFSGAVLFLLGSDEAGSAQNTSQHSQEAAKQETATQETATQAAATPEVKETPKRQIASTGDHSGCLLSESALEDLKQRRLELDAREHALATQETELKAGKAALEEELKKISSVRDAIVKLQTLHKKDQEEKVAKLVEAFETMSPKASSQLLSGVDEVLAVEAMGKISTQKLAKIMNVMETRALTRLTERMAGVTQATKKLASNGALEVTDQSRKGGDQYDGQNHASTAVSREPARETGVSQAASSPAGGNTNGRASSSP